MRKSPPSAPCRPPRGPARLVLGHAGVCQSVLHPAPWPGVALVAAETLLPRTCPRPSVPRSSWSPSLDSSSSPAPCPFVPHSHSKSSLSPTLGHTSFHGHSSSVGWQLRFPFLHDQAGRRKLKATLWVRSHRRGSITSRVL